jgi:mono/diheme cytochrome c family protein
MRNFAIVLAAALILTPGISLAQMQGGMGQGMMGGGMMEGQGCRSPRGRQQQYRGRTSGADLFARNCAACHAHGGNAINPNFPVLGAPQLKSYDSFRALMRQGRGAMPAFSSDRIPDSQLWEFYRYLRSAYGTN